MKQVLGFILFLLTACARIMPPPGGPVDRLPPRLSGTRPDSLASFPDFKGDVEFQFSEVISENGQPNFGTGTGGLEKLVIVSPARGVPVVKWKRDPREAFDTIRVDAGRDSVGELWAFKHDSTGPRIQAIARNDSLSATITFVHALDPAVKRIPRDSIRVRLLPDSTPVAVEALVTQQLYDSLFKPKRDSTAKDSLRADSLKARRDTTKARPDTVPAQRDTVPPRPSGIPRLVTGARRRPAETARQDLEPLKTKPPLVDKLILRMVDPLREGSKYVVEANGVRTVSGVVGNTRFTLVIEAPKKVDAKKDSLKTKPDSLKAPADTVRP